jgi:CzcA family heavy metal efflux pump
VLRNVVALSLRNRGVVLTLAAVLFGFGVYAAATSPLDVFPEFAPPQVTVETEAPGMTTTEVEALVTRRLELAINGTPGLVRLTSSSQPGVSSLTAIFADDTEVYRDRQLVAERVATVASALPASVSPPELVPQTSASSTVEVVAVTWEEGFDPVAARSFVDWTLAPRLLSVAGISKVVAYGGRVAQMQVIVDPDSLRSYDLSLDDLEAAARDATAVGPAGTMAAEGQQLPILTASQAEGAADLENAVVAFRNGAPLLLSRVATVRVGGRFPIGDGSLDGRPAVVLLVARQPGVNTLRVTRELDAALAEIAAQMPSGLRLHAGLFRQASFIERAIGNLRATLLVAAVLVALVLVVFLVDLGTALVSLTAIPLSLLTAVLVLHGFGATINTMTLGGLAIALGEVVDDSIIDVENIHRRWRLDRASGRPRPLHDVILDASLEVRSPVVYATFLVALVFLPVFFLSGVAGKIFSPLAAAYVLSTLASLVVALVVTPAACSLLLARRQRGRGESRLAAALKRGYEPLLRRVLGHPFVLAAAGLALFLAAIVATPLLAGEFLPAFEENDFIVHMVGLPGTSLAASLAAGEKVERRLLGIPGVVSVAQRAGRGELADEVSGPEASELDVRLAADSDVHATVERIRSAIASFPGFSFAVNQFLSERIEEVTGGETAPVAVSVFGPDLDRLQSLAGEVARTMASLPGARDVSVEPLTSIPQVVVAFDRGRAARLGTTVRALQAAVATAFEGTQVGELFRGGQILPLVVKFPDASRADLDAIRRLPVRVASGVVPLSEVAEVRVEALPAAITRLDGSRRVVVTCSTDADVSGFTRTLEAGLRGISLPSGYAIEVSGDYASQMKGVRELALVGLVSLVGIFLLLLTDFRSARLATLVMLNLPLALIGGVGAALLFHLTLSLGTVVGFVTLFGITARNGVLLVAHWRHLSEGEGESFGPELVVRGSLDRLTPILMTALVTGLALLPLVASGARAGQEIEHPMAVVIVGGLVSSTLLNLLALPAFYLRWAKPRGRRASESTP